MADTPTTPERVYITARGVTPDSFVVLYHTHGERTGPTSILMMRNYMDFEYPHGDLLVFMSGLAWACLGVLVDRHPDSGVTIEARGRHHEVLRTLVLDPHTHKMHYDGQLR